jgi:photosystem II stability/assembly factor-like uncharacterized protein
LVIPTVITSPSIQDSGWLSTDQGWVVLENRLYWTDDRGSNWQDITPAPVQVAYFLPSGEAWALSNTDTENLSLFHSNSWGKTWDSTILSLPLESFSPLQLSFTSPSSGWIVLQKQTSQAFDIGMLLKTADGGVTWTSSDVPTAAPIQFVSSTEGWLVDPHSGALYRTLDGGLTWQQRRSETGDPTLTSLPKDSTLSGSQTSTLGWSATSTNNCQGEKSSPGFTCTVENVLWQSLDGGNTWQNIPLPTLTQAEP